MSASAYAQPMARTAALRRALDLVRDRTSAADLLFIEAWLMDPAPGAAAALRVVQIRRANPTLVAEINAEIAHKRPLTAAERAELGKSVARARN